MRYKVTVFDVVVYAIMLFVLVVTFYPFLYVIAISFSDTLSIVQNKVTFYPRGFNVDAYRMILQSPMIPRAYLNTIIYTVVGVTFNMVFTIAMAYALSKKHLKGRKFFVTIVVITMFVNGGMIPNYLVVNMFGLIDSMWALVFPNLIWTFELLILKSFCENLPEELFEAAKIDGAHEFKILARIVVPLSKAALATVALFYIIGHWNSFFAPMIYLHDMKRHPLQVILRSMLIEDTVKTQSTIGEFATLTPMSLKNATIFISILPMLVLYPFIQKFFTKGIMLGSVKG